MSIKIAVIPDTQIKPEYDLSFLRNIGNYLVEKKPDVVVQIGDWADMPSLSSYDVGKKQFEGRRYRSDIDAAIKGMEILLSPFEEYNRKARKNKEKLYKPRLVLTLGNHEQRIVKAVESDPKLEGVLNLTDLQYEQFGWEVYPFLQPVIIEDIAFCHYFISGQMGKPCVSAQSQLSKMHQSCVAGHQQGLQIALGHRADGKRITSVIAGSAYMHEESYLNPQSNNHWRGVFMLHNVKDGEFDLVPVPLEYLNRKYK